MTQVVTPKSQLSELYDRDLNLWLENAIGQLQAGDLQNLDVENLIEELQGLAGRDRHEVENRLIRLIEHILKRRYVNMSDCFRGWEVTIVGQRDRLRRKLKQSPSLKRHLVQSFDECFLSALELLQTEYPDIYFSNSWEFDRDLDVILSSKFWS